MQCSNPLLNLEKSITATLGRRSHGRPQRSDDFDCTLCLKLLYEPITTPCGHSYCRACLFQSMDRCKFQIFYAQSKPDFFYMLNYNHHLLFFLLLFLTLWTKILQITDVPCAEQFFSLVPEHVQSGQLLMVHPPIIVVLHFTAETAASLFFFFHFQDS